PIRVRPQARRGAFEGERLLGERDGVRASVISILFRNDPSVKIQVSCPAEGGDRLHLKNRRSFDPQSRKVRRRKRVFLPIGRGGMLGVLLEEIDVHELGLGIDQPQLLDAAARKYASLGLLVQPGRFRRKDFHNEIRRPFRARVGENGLVFLRDKHQVRLVHVDIVEVNVEGRGVELADWMLLKISAEQQGDGQRNVLMVTGRRWCHKQVSYHKVYTRAAVET